MIGDAKMVAKALSVTLTTKCFKTVVSAPLLILLLRNSIDSLELVIGSHVGKNTHHAGISVKRDQHVPKAGWLCQNVHSWWCCCKWAGTNQIVQ